MHYSTPNHGGIIVCRDDRNWQQLAERIDKGIVSIQSLKGQLVYVNRQ